MTDWECGIEECGERFDTVEETIVHQTTDHKRPECKVCGSVGPDGYFAIRHAFDEHSRAEYVRAYGASAAEVRERERVRDSIEEQADLQQVVNKLDEVTGGL